jgi:hypothetical protein
VSKEAQLQAKKKEIISSLSGIRRKILDAASSLPPERQDEVFLGVWTIKDLLAHLVGWDYTNLEAAKSLLRGELPAFYAHEDPGWKTYNARLIAKYKLDDFSKLLSSVAESQRELSAYLQTIPAQEFHKDRGIRYKRYKVTIARLLQVEAKDEQTHLQQIEKLRNMDT